MIADKMFPNHLINLFVMFCIIPVAILGMCPNIISRSQWNARARRGRSSSLSQKPAPYVVIHHSDTPSCNSEGSCKTRVVNIQNFHMNNNNWDDIGYNFLIGGDGSVYEGRGWNVRGAHHPRYNSKSIGVCLIGNFSSNLPSQAQLTALEKLLSCGVEKREIKSDYSLIGHRQRRDTTCPGDALFGEIKKWPHFNNNPQ